MKTWIKICGTTSLKDAQASIGAGADALGFIFASSPRQVQPEEVGRITPELPLRIETVGVFANHSVDMVRKMARQAGVSAVQLHGNESPKMLGELREALGKKKRIIKSVSALSNLEDIFLEFAESGWLPDAFLLDSPREASSFSAGNGHAPRGENLNKPHADSGNFGGGGSSFDWEWAAPTLRRVTSEPRLAHCQIIVAGGLNPGNVGKAIRVLQPQGVDVVSGVESKPGEKDAEKLKQFVAAVRAADRQKHGAHA